MGLERRNLYAKRESLRLYLKTLFWFRNVMELIQNALENRFGQNIGLVRIKNSKLNMTE
jgi:hypothetical protein